MAEAVIPAPQRIVTGMKPLILLVGVGGAIPAGGGAKLWEWVRPFSLP